LALLLLAAGLHKSTNLGRVRSALAGYRAVPFAFAKPIPWVVIAVEVTVGVTLMVPSTSHLASLAAAGVFAAYFAVMGLSWLLSHRVVDCGCSFHDKEVPLSGAHLIRNALLLIMAVVGFEPITERAVSWADSVQIGAAVAFLALLYLAEEDLLSHRRSVAIREA
jgi:uncharacterized membrane protein YphA (DoxX/SURF4 family)